ncbi:hypothetical protein BDF22DRAFT_703939 [Syncephalis plumigaleata]|nr:hypothetical protein BDF22DRAFT_703939 [Syncephalis plumigaleata]
MDGRRGANTTGGTGHAGGGVEPRRTQSRADTTATPARLAQEHARGRGRNQRHRSRRQGRNSDAVAQSNSSDPIREDATLIRTSANRKGQISLTHMLNFSLPPRQPSSLSGPRRRRGNYTPFNKERFINANFRFVVRPSGDYTVQAVDPDVPIEWTDVEQVIIVAEEEAVCPICLSKPVAPRVTRCGHIFCFSCILRYLATDTVEDDMRRKHEDGIGIAKRHWRKCPFNALRGVIFINGQNMAAMKQHLPTGSENVASTGHTHYVCD